MLMCVAIMTHEVRAALAYAPQRHLRSGSSPTDHVDNFVQKLLADLAKHAAMRVCVKTMTNKADKKSMKSIACTEKSAAAPVFGMQRGTLRRCGVVGSGRTMAERMVAHD